ncbi:HEAT repeat domain-containing protein [Williamsia sp. 1135]|uniref:HEAT repeat domain-containing protein n=1 Tax=Williamsia sp. 1135 TaxID=1889262 RepID=UPI00197D68F8|nr:HEAT repeat domain-containing protein [Williamsia sp. 1135]
MSTPHNDQNTRLRSALSAPNSSIRLRAALAAGTTPDPSFVQVLVERCAIEPDFFVRDMLTWALTRHSVELTVPTLLTELHSNTPQARSQSLHTLSKIADKNLWRSIPKSLLHDADDEVARAAWRTAVVLVPHDEENDLAGELITELGRGDRDMKRSLSRALIALSDAISPLLNTATTSNEPAIRAHARATERLLADPESEFTITADDAKRIVNAGNAMQDE